MATVVQMTKPCGHLILAEVSLGRPSSGEVVETEAIGMNFIDIYHRQGLYPLPAYPGILGVVEEVGPDVTGIRFSSIGRYAQSELIGQ